MPDQNLLNVSMIPDSDIPEVVIPAGLPGNGIWGFVKASQLGSNAASLTEAQIAAIVAAQIAEWQVQNNGAISTAQQLLDSRVTRNESAIEVAESGIGELLGRDEAQDWAAIGSDIAIPAAKLINAPLNSVAVDASEVVQDVWMPTPPNQTSTQALQQPNDNTGAYGQNVFPVATFTPEFAGIDAIPADADLQFSAVFQVAFPSGTAGAIPTARLSVTFAGSSTVRYNIQINTDRKQIHIALPRDFPYGTDKSLTITATAENRGSTTEIAIELNDIEFVLTGALYNGVLKIAQTTVSDEDQRQQTEIETVQSSLATTTAAAGGNSTNLINLREHLDKVLQLNAALTLQEVADTNIIPTPLLTAQSFDISRLKFGGLWFNGGFAVFGATDFEATEIVLTQGLDPLLYLTDGVLNSANYVAATAARSYTTLEHIAESNNSEEVRIAFNTSSSITFTNDLPPNGATVVDQVEYVQLGMNILVDGLSLFTPRFALPIGNRDNQLPATYFVNDVYPSTVVATDGSYNVELDDLFDADIGDLGIRLNFKWSDGHIVVEMTKHGFNDAINAGYMTIRGQWTQTHHVAAAAASTSYIRHPGLTAAQSGMAIALSLYDTDKVRVTVGTASGGLQIDTNFVTSSATIYELSSGTQLFRGYATAPLALSFVETLGGLLHSPYMGLYQTSESHHTTLTLPYMLYAADAKGTSFPVEASGQHWRTLWEGATVPNLWAEGTDEYNILTSPTTQAIRASFSHNADDPYTMLFTKGNNGFVGVTLYDFNVQQIERKSTIMTYTGTQKSVLIKLEYLTGTNE